jgi:hypothetical protein
MPKIIATTADGRTREFWPEQYAVACDWLNTQQPQFADQGFARFGAVLRHVSEVEAAQQDAARRRRRLRDEERRMYLTRQGQSVSFLIRKPEDARCWEIPRGTEIPAGWELEAEAAVYGLNETGEFQGNYDDPQGWSFAWKAAWHTGQYVIGQPGTELVSLNVFHGTWNSRRDTPAPDEIQPAVMLTRDQSAEPADGMYDMLDVYGEEFTLNFERHVYRQPVQFDQPKCFSGFDAEGCRRTVTYWWTRG